MKLTLNRLHKLKSTLEKELGITNSGWDNTGRLDLERFYTVSLTDDSAHSVRVAEQFLEKQKTDLERCHNLSKDLAAIKSAIIRGNVETGINEILNTLPVLRRILGTLKKWKNKPFNNSNPTYSMNSVTATRLKELKQVSSEGHVNLELITEPELQRRIVELNKMIRELEDNQDKMNSEYEVEIELAEETKDVLGL